ncbi:MAG: CO dehydrogenase/acetyl-CoA synthase subunit delta [Candidatus Nezhaarchaeota archaeon]|nr:CO dehydrogenase/acetyl-CoA synthase subunit delta [Candidatus Nezhaarchaeota archaeon]
MSVAEAKAPREVKSFIEALSQAKEVELRDVEVLAEEVVLHLITQAPQVLPPEVQQAHLYLEEAAKLLRQALGVPAAPSLAAPIAPTPRAAPAVLAPPAPPVLKPELAKVKFEPPTLTYPGSIAEVTIGATSSEGGTRKRVVKIGGEKAPPFYRFLSATPHRPVVALDVFDLAPPLPKTIKSYYKDVLKDHVAWVNKCIEEFKADLVTLHLVSTDPALENKPAEEAAKFVRKVLDRVDVPVIVGGSGNPEKDAVVFEKVAEATAGERLVMASVTVDMAVEKVAQSIYRHGHNVLTLAFLDINQVKELNRRVLKAGVPKDHVITDPSTGGLGYGIEYTFSVMERVRLAGLMGEEAMQVPISCAATNAWAAREAWMEVAEWGPREYRGPLWEATTALVNMLAGADLFMMLHPLAASMAKKFAEALSRPKVEKELRRAAYEKWVSAKF